MRSPVRRLGTIALVLAAAPTAVAPAAGPGDTLLVSGPPGLGPLALDAFAWNLSGRSAEEDGVTSIGVSADGTRVAFVSAADGMAPGLDTRFEHVFVKDRTTGAITAIAPQAAGSASHPTLSSDGSRVAFLSKAPNLAVGDTSTDADVFVADVASGAVTLATPGTTTDAHEPVMAGGGAFVAFSTGESLDGVDTNGERDVYRVPTDGSGTYVLASRVGAGAVGNGDSRDPSISDDGTRIAFHSEATNLTAGDADTQLDVYVRNVSAVSTTLVSRSAGGVASANGPAYGPRISGDGASVAYSSAATDATVADADASSDVLVTPVTGSPNVLVSRATGAMGANADGQSEVSSISDDGLTVTFDSSATNLGGPAAVFTTYVRRLGPATTTNPFAADRVTAAQVSGNGAYVAAFAQNDPVGDGSIAQVRGVAATGGALDLVSAPPGGALVPRFTDVDYAFYDGPGNVMSADGRHVVFSTSAPGFSAAGNPGEELRCFRRDMRTGEVVPITPETPDPDYCTEPTISADGRFVAFGARSSLVPGGVPGVVDAFVRDLVTGEIVVVSRGDGVGGARSDASSTSIRLSADGRRVVFVTDATTFGPGGGDEHVYVRDLVAGTTTLVDRATGVDGAVGNEEAEVATIDADGSRVAFATRASNLGDGDADTIRDIFVRDLDTHTTQLVSRRSDADGGAKSTNLSTTPWISGDGNTVVFRAFGQNLDTSMGAWPTTPQLVARDLVGRTTRVVSRDGPSGALLDASLGPAALTHDGRTLFYEAAGNDGAIPALAIPDSGSGVVRRDLVTGAQSLVSASVVDPTISAAQGSRAPAVTPDGACVAFVDRSRDLVPGVSPDFDHLFLRVLAGDCGTVAPIAGPGPGPGTGPGTTPPPGPGATAAPRLTSVSLLRSRFRVGPRRTATTASARRRTPVGTAFRFTLAAPATVRIVIERRTTGRRVGRSCRKATRALRRRKACVRYVRVGTLTRRNLAAGRRSVAFSGRIGSKALAPGRYRASLRATDAAGRTGPVVRRAFTVVRR